MSSADQDCALAEFPAAVLRGQQLRIPNLWPAFASWKQGVNPAYGRVKQAVDMRLEGLISDKRALTKVKAGDLGLFASGVFPDADYDVLETVALYCVWLFLWDDAIDGASADDGEGAVVAEEYCRRSVAFLRHHLGLDESGTSAPEAPTTVCESFAEFARRVGEWCGLEQRRELFEHLREYMDACVTEYRWRLSGKVPSVDEFYSWRLKTSSVDVMLVLCRILNRISLPHDVLGSRGLYAMGLSVNKLLILINELFSLKKELRDGAFGNLIPITMRSSGHDLASCTQSVIDDIQTSILVFEENASTLQAAADQKYGPEAAAQLRRLIEAYQAIATSVLNFSIQSPRYGLLRDRREDGSFVVDL